MTWLHYVAAQPNLAISLKRQSSAGIASSATVNDLTSLV
jgi:hypothetical protein